MTRTEKFLPIIKHIVVKCHHFCENFIKGTVKIKQVDTNDQLACVFIKYIPRLQFQKLRKVIQIWMAMLVRLAEDVSGQSTNTKFVFNALTHILF